MLACPYGYELHKEGRASKCAACSGEVQMPPLTVDERESRRDRLLRELDDDPPPSLVDTSTEDDDDLPDDDEPPPGLVDVSAEDEEDDEPAPGLMDINDSPIGQGQFAMTDSTLAAVADWANSMMREHASADT